MFGRVKVDMGGVGLWSTLLLPDKLAVTPPENPDSGQHRGTKEQHTADYQDSAVELVCQPGSRLFGNRQKDGSFRVWKGSFRNE